MKPKPFSALNHFTVPVAMSHAFQPMNASHTVRKTEVIALVPAAQHRKKPTPKAWAKGTPEPRHLTQTLHAHNTPSPEETGTRHDLDQARRPAEDRQARPI